MGFGMYLLEVGVSDSLGLLVVSDVDRGLFWEDLLGCGGWMEAGYQEILCEFVF